MMAMTNGKNDEIAIWRRAAVTVTVTVTVNIENATTMTTMKVTGTTDERPGLQDGIEACQAIAIPDGDATKTRMGRDEMTATTAIKSVTVSANGVATRAETVIGTGNQTGVTDTAMMTGIARHILPLIRRLDTAGIGIEKAKAILTGEDGDFRFLSNRKSIEVVGVYLLDVWKATILIP